jgi:hypothetical protein
MNLQESIKYRMNVLFCDFLGSIAQHYSINHNELIALVSTININRECLHIMTNGKNKGKQCPGKILDNNFCKKHQRDAGIVAGLFDKVVKTPEITKTQKQILEWLETAIPNQETILKRHTIGLIDENTDIIFNDDYVVIGKLNNGTLGKLSDHDINICEKQGWQYSEDIIEQED